MTYIALTGLDPVETLLQLAGGEFGVDVLDGTARSAASFSAAIGARPGVLSRVLRLLLAERLKTNRRMRLERRSWANARYVYTFQQDQQ